MNIMLFILMIILAMFFVFISLSLFEKEGLKYVYIIYNIVSFITSFKILELASININASIITSSLFYLLTYIISIKSSEEEYKKIIKQTLCINIFLAISIFIASLYIGTVNGNSAINMKYLYLYNYKILISYPILTLVNQLAIFIIYNNIKEVTKSEIKNISLSCLTTLMLDSILFNTFSYIFKLDFAEIIALILSNYLIKVLITLIYIFITKLLLNNKKVKL